MKHAWIDPVVQETRERGRAYTQRLGEDVHLIFEDLRRHRKEHPDRYVGLEAVGPDKAPEHATED